MTSPSGLQGRDQLPSQLAVFFPVSRILSFINLGYCGNNSLGTPASSGKFFIFVRNQRVGNGPGDANLPIAPQNSVLVFRMVKIACIYKRKLDSFAERQKTMGKSRGNIKLGFCFSADRTNERPFFRSAGEPTRISRGHIQRFGLRPRGKAWLCAWTQIGSAGPRRVPRSELEWLFLHKRIQLPLISANFAPGGRSP